MCLAIPGKIIELLPDGNSALVDFDGLKQKVVVALIENPQVGKYVIIHAGYAIEMIDEKEAMVAINQWKEIAEDQNMKLSDVI